MGVDSFKRVPPHPRGWSRCGSRPEPGCRGSPAPAGMVPGPLAPTSRYRRFPRTRGDGPYFSHGRWTNAPVPPHPRGWSRRGAVRHARLCGSPAPAGMVPARQVLDILGQRFPRTRGDGPQYGWITAGIMEVPPHPRGWSPYHRSRHDAHGGSPAPAGMVPRWKAVGAATAGFPRTRGDGPHSHPTPADAPSVPPHPRGWSPIRRVRPRLALGSPAPAGMVP